MDSLTVIAMILSAVVSFVLASSIWYFFDARQTRDLEDLADSLMEQNDIQKDMIKSLLRDNKRLLATLNHYNIKRVIKEPMPIDVFADNIGEGTEIYFGGKKI